MNPIVFLFLLAGVLRGADDDYLHWDLKKARSTALSARVNGKVGSSFDLRGLHTERSFNYKLRATWLTPEVIRACGRIEQLSRVLPDSDVRQLVREAEEIRDTVMLIEIDPREGSGIIPSTWSAVFSPVIASGQRSRSVAGISTPALAKLAALSGGARRDYDYDVFWVVFHLETDSGEALFGPDDRFAELTVHINGKVGNVRWPLPFSVTRRVGKSLPR